MKDWDLHLKKDLLADQGMVYSSLSERISTYKHFYIKEQEWSSVPKRGSSDCSPARALWQSEQTASLSPSFQDQGSDIHTSDAVFSALLCCYTAQGKEYSFSRRGWRCVTRGLPWQGHYHTHDFIEILYVVKGEFQQILLGEKQTFHEGEFVITDRNISHADFLCGGSDSCVLFLWLQADYLNHLLSVVGQDHTLHQFFFHALQRQRQIQSYTHLYPSQALEAGRSSGSLLKTDETGRKLDILLEQLVYEDFSPSVGSSEIIAGNLKKLLSLLCWNYSLKLHSSDRENKEQTLFYEVDRYIRLHFQTVTASQLEKTFHYHRNYFNLLFQIYTGCTFVKYVQKLRLDHAAEALLTTNLSVKEIAMSCGYHNNSHFYHLFEEVYGMSPGDYRSM